MRYIAAASLHRVCILLTLIALATAPMAFGQTNLPSFAKTFAPSTIGPGGVSVLELTITNGTSSPIRNLAFVDSLPAGMTIADPSAAVSTCVGGTLDAPVGGGAITYSSGGIGASSSCAITVNVTISTPGTHTNVTGDLTSDNGNSGSATADLTVATDRPGFSKTFSPNAVFFGGRSTLTLAIDNSANASGAANVSFTDNLPSGMVIASPSNAATDCGGGNLVATSGSSVVSYGPAFFGDATVGAGATCTVTVDVLGNSVGELGNVTDELTSTPPFGGVARSSGKASATLSVSFEQISLTKSFIDDPVAPGGTVTLELTVRNLDRRSSASNIAFTDDLEAVLSGLTAVGLPASDVCGTGSSLSGTSLLTLTGGNLPAESSCTFSVSLDVPSTAAAGDYLNTTSAITADIGGEPVSGTPATDVLFVEPAPILTKSFIDDPAGAGGTVTLEFSLTNTSPDQAATDMTFTDVFDVVLPTASSVPTSDFCGTGSTASYTPLIDTGGSSNPAQLRISGANLGPGESCAFSITLDVAIDAASGTYPNVTSGVSATVGEGRFVGRPASDDLEIVGAPSLLKEFIDDPAAPGGTVTLEFTLTHDENAPGDATGITFTDDLNAALAGLVATGLPASDVCGVGSSLSGTMTLLLTGGTLAPGESCSFSVTLQVPGDAAPGAYGNTTSAVLATVLGVETMSNSASDDLRIVGLVLSKEFTDDPVLPGGTVTLRFTVENQSQSSGASAIFFVDDLDAAIDGMAASGLPLNDICGVGSSLIGLSGNTRLVFQNGVLAAGESCAFEVTMQVPAATVPDLYTNVTSSFVATIDGSMVVFDNAFDDVLVANDLLLLEKEFTNDPVAPGENVDLRFTITNVSATDAVTDIAFTDDLDSALSGLASVSGTLADVCGVGSEISGAGLLTFSGGSLGAGASCAFVVTLAVPPAVPLGDTATNVTSSVIGSIGGLEVRGDPATDVLRIDALEFSKSFSEGPFGAGDTVTLNFTIENLSATDPATALGFTDNLDAMLSGLVAIGLPASDVCGEGSTLSGASFLALTEASLLPGGSCTFSVDLVIPATAAAGTYLNVTSDLVSQGLPVADPATASFEIVEEVDADGDGVLDSDDVCADTVIPEGVPTRELKPNRYALVDEDTIFDTNRPPGGGPGDVFTTTDTAGCSCEQIIEALGLGNGHTKFGCSLGAMRNWVLMVSGDSAFLSYRNRL